VLGKYGAITIVILLLACQTAWAVELASFAVEDEGKAVRATFNFSEDVVYDDIYHYANNFVALDVAGLTVSREMLATNHFAQTEELARYYRYIRFVAEPESTQVRVYLAKPVDPSDVLVIPHGSYVELEIVKPLWKMPADGLEATEEEPLVANGEQPDAVTAEQPTAAASPSFIPDEEFSIEPDASESEIRDLPPLPATEEPETLESASDPANSFRTAAPVETPETGGPPEFVPTPETPASEDLGETQPNLTGPNGEPEPQPSAPEGVIYPGTPFEELLYPADENGEATAGPETSSAESSTRPVRDIAPQPDYREFSLDEVQVANVLIRGKPFREALMELVGDCGFNVVVADGIDNKPVVLDFRHKNLSLKHALEILTIAYDLTYIVEEDAIIIKAAD